jgi:hypothetical protein
MANAKSRIRYKKKFGETPDKFVYKLYAIVENGKTM